VLLPKKMLLLINQLLPKLLRQRPPKKRLLLRLPRLPYQSLRVLKNSKRSRTVLPLTLVVVRVVVAVAVVVAVVIAEAVVAEAVVIDQKVSPENPDLREKDAVAIVVAVAVVTDQELLYPLHQLVKASRVPSMKVVCPNALKDLKDVVVSVVDVVNVVPDMKANLVKKTTH
jgi:hypothetical protein